MGGRGRCFDKKSHMRTAPWICHWNFGSIADRGSHAFELHSKLFQGADRGLAIIERNKSFRLAETSSRIPYGAGLGDILTVDHRCWLQGASCSRDEVGPTWSGFHQSGARRRGPSDWRRAELFAFGSAAGLDRGRLLYYYTDVHGWIIIQAI